MHYIAVQLDQNTRKQVCRFWLNADKKYISLFDESKKETRYELHKLDDMYAQEDYLIQTAKRLGSAKEKHEVIN